MPLNGPGIMSGDLMLPFMGPYYYAPTSPYGGLHEATVIEYVKKQMLVLHFSLNTWIILNV